MTDMSQHSTSRPNRTISHFQGQPTRQPRPVPGAARPAGDPIRTYAGLISFVRAVAGFSWAKKRWYSFLSFLHTWMKELRRGEADALGEDFGPFFPDRLEAHLRKYEDPDARFHNSYQRTVLNQWRAYQGRQAEAEASMESPGFPISYQELIEENGRNLESLPGLAGLVETHCDDLCSEVDTLDLWLAQNGLGRESLIGPEFHEAFAAFLACWARRLPGGRAALDHKARLLKWRLLYRQILLLRNLPAAFSERLMALWRLRREQEPLPAHSRQSAWGVARLARRVGLRTDNARLLNRWSDGRQLPSVAHLPIVERLEREFNVPAGTLTGLMPPQPAFRGAHGAYVINSHHGREFPKTQYGSHCAALAALPYRHLWSDWSEPLAREWEQYYQFSTAPFSCDYFNPLQRSPQAGWRVREDGRCPTEEVYRPKFEMFFGFLTQPKKHEEPRLRGPGMGKGKLSMALVADVGRVEQFLEFSRLRSNSGLDSLQTEAVLMSFASLLKPREGFLWLHPGLFCRHGSFTKHLKKIREAAAKSGVRLNTVEDAWRFHCETARGHLLGALKRMRFQGKIQNSRGKEPIEAICQEMAHPMDALFELEEGLARQLPHLSPETTTEALFLRDLFCVKLVHRHAFRVELLCDLRVSDFARLPRGNFRLTLTAERFKNFKHTAREGFSGELDAELSAILERYLTAGRPRLNGGEDPACDFLLLGNKRGGRKRKPSTRRRGEPSPFRLNPKLFSRHYRDLTRTYIPHLSPAGFRIHAVRDIVATDFIRSDPVLGWGRAAVALFDTEQTIREHYAHLRFEDRMRDYAWALSERLLRYHSRKAD